MKAGNHGNPATEILIPFGPAYLRLTPEEYAKITSRGLSTMPNTTTSDAAPQIELLTSEQMEQHTSIPASWWETAARESRVKCYRFGKYIRYRLEEAAADAAEARR